MHMQGMIILPKRTHVHKMPQDSLPPPQFFLAPIDP